MTSVEFDTKQKVRSRWVVFLDTSELLVLSVCFCWGLQLLLTGFYHLHDRDYTFEALSKIFHGVPIVFGGWYLVIISILHVLSFAIRQYGLRRICILLQAIFFSITWWSLLLTHSLFPGVFILPCYLISSCINYASLIKTRNDEKDIIGRSS